MTLIVCKRCGGEWDAETTSCKVCGGQEATTAKDDALRVMTRKVEDGRLIVTGRLRVQLQIVDEATGEPLFVVGDGSIVPGDTFSWTYPPDGLGIAQ